MTDTPSRKKANKKDAENAQGGGENGGGEKRLAAQVADLLEGAADTVTSYRCERHPSRRATSICEACGADICSDCSHVRSHRLICSNCMGGLDRAFAGTGAASPFTRLLTHPFVIALVIAGLLGVFFVRIAHSQRLGLLGRETANVGESEKQFKLKLLLFSRKALRIEKRGDSLLEQGRGEAAGENFYRAKAVCEDLIDDTGGRWEQPLLMLARARLLQKLGDEAYAEGLYENVATMREPESPDSSPDNFDPSNFGLNDFGFQNPKRTHSVIALLRLGKIQEGKDTAIAVRTYAKLLREIKNIPAHVRSAINLTAGSIEPYDYETRMHHFTGNDLNFNDIEAEANLRMGLVFAKQGHDNHAHLKFSLAAERADDPLIVKWALSEEAKLNSRMRETSGVGGIEEDAPSPLEERKGPSEKVVITHF